MKDVDEEVQKPQPVDVEDVVYHLFKAWPAAKYIALNNALTVSNDEEWKDHWYFIGFLEQPVYQDLAGYPKWVARQDIHFADQEWGLFFMHVSSKDLLFRGVPIQNSPDDFASCRWFCWEMAEDRETMTQLISEEVIHEDKTEEFNANFKDMIGSTLLKPAMEALKPRERSK